MPAVSLFKTAQGFPNKHILSQLLYPTWTWQPFGLESHERLGEAQGHAGEAAAALAACGVPHSDLVPFYCFGWFSADLAGFRNVEKRQHELRHAQRA